MQVIKVKSNEEIDLLSGYLHDSYLYVNGINLDNSQACLYIDIYRISYEQAKPGKFLGIFPIIRYPEICSQIEIRNVIQIEYNWKDDTFNQPNDKHTLLDISLEDKKVKIETEWLILEVTLQEFEGIIVTDLESLTKRYRCFDWGRQSVFRGTDQIEKIKVDI